MKFSELYSFFHEKYGINHLSDIARELNVTPQAVSNWKSRDSVPYKYVLKSRQKFKELDSYNVKIEKEKSIATKKFNLEEGSNKDFHDEIISLTEF